MEGPSFFATGVSLVKDLRAGKFRVQFRAEAFKVCNQKDGRTIPTSVPNANVPTATAHEAQRIQQFGAKLSS